MGILHEISPDMMLYTRNLLMVAVLFCTSMAAISQLPDYILLRKSYKPEVTSINFSPDGTLLLTGYANGSLRILDPATFEVSLELKEAHQKAVTGIVMPPKMDFFMSAGGNQLKMWERVGQLKANLNAHATTIWNLDISQNGKYALSTAFNKTFLLWDLDKARVEAHMRAHEDVTLTACFSPDNKLIASGSNDKTIKVWDLESREVISTLHGPTGEIYDLAFSPDSRMVAAGSAENSVRVYNLEEKSLVHVLKGHRSVVRKVDFSPDGLYLLSASEDNSIILWDVFSGDKIYAFTENQGAVLDVKFHPGGEFFYSVSMPGDLTRWALDPEIFVIRYYDESYRKELASDPLFAPRAKGESKKDYQLRQEEASTRKAEIISKYYNKYLEKNE